jgi:hypothetical protein
MSKKNGGLSSKTPAYAGGNKDVVKEAKAGKNIGKVGPVSRKRGGACKASGGGADTSPYSSAGKGLRQKRGGAC